jgi:serine/threonine-protein kinase
MTATTERLSAALADRYMIDRELGQGGMATVYLAEDLKHKRKVALKVLRPELAAVLGAERFVQEITTTASLQHPHILPLYDSGRTGGRADGRSDDFLFYVMPYIQGETLREKLDRETQLGVDEAVRITCEVADALHHAHQQGVIHRDIKPENILLQNGRALVADFGIALAVSAAAGGRMTETGLSLGTPHYMSPEQATAEKDLTARSDVYSLGSVLYEMLTGNPPHVGASAQQIIMKIVTEEAAPVTAVRKSVPAHVAAATATALEKLPADRFASAAEFGAALQNPGFATTSTAATTRRTAVPPYRRTAFVPALAATTVLAAALAAWGWLRPEPAVPVIRYRLALPEDQQPSAVLPPVASPDGSLLIYAGPVPDGQGVQLWVKPRDRDVATPLANTFTANAVAFSPDGQSIVFGTAAGDLRTLSLSGGTALTVVSDSVAGFLGVAWRDDGSIVFVRPGPGGTGLRQVPSGGGEAVPVLTREPAVIEVGPVALPGNRGLLFSRCAAPSDCNLWVHDFTRDRTSTVARGTAGYAAAYASTGHVLYVAGSALIAVPFDLDRLEVTGAPVSLADGVQLFTLSASGTLLLITGEGAATSPTFRMVWVDRAGHEAEVDTTWTFRLAQFAGNAGWALSPDGTRLAIGVNTDEGDDIWVKPLPRGPASRITFDQGPDYRPRWTPDGTFVTFKSNRGAGSGIYARRADGTGSDSLLVVAPSAQEAVISPDGRWLLMRGGGAVGPGGRDIVGLRLGEDTAAVPVLATRFDELAISPSPDGRWLVYQSDETGRPEVFVRPFPDVDRGKWQVSSGGGRAPLWSRDGRELFYVSAADDMMAVRVRAGSTTLELGEPVALFQIPDDLLWAENTYYTPWDVARDGRFLMARRITDAEAPDQAIVVVENFFEELKPRMGK